MSRVYNRYKQRNVANETTADIDRKHREAVSVVDASEPADPPAQVRGTPLVEIDSLGVAFGRGRSKIRAVDDVSFNVGHGEAIGLVGESGCGKSSLVRALVRLETPDSGSIRFEGRDLASLKGDAFQHFRTQAQMIFQDPFGSLNPRLQVGGAIREVLTVHQRGSRKQRASIVGGLLESVGLDPGYANRYPHEFSGGQRQRIGIARALAVQPRLLIADEPVSALDVSVQVQILNLLKDLQRDHKLTILFVAHDLAVVRYLCSRILVMYLGRIVETAGSGPLYSRPLHPYTKALMSAVPDVSKSLEKRKTGKGRLIVEGDVPSLTTTFKGCPFQARCLFSQERCSEEAPPLREVRAGHYAACHYAEDLMSIPA
jgi:oligopeptide/dipeptide ABC transporter ATP-binding protein